MIVQWLLRIYILAVNVFLFVMMGSDKRSAEEGTRRVPEADLFLLALLGGSMGGTAGMLAFRHKTRHWSFVIGFPLMLLAQVVIAMWLKLFILV